MEISKRRFAFCIVLTALLSIGVTYAWQNGIFLKPHQEARIRANVYITIENAFGMYDLATGNVITDYGENITRNFFSGGGTVDNLDYIAYGNASGTLTGKTALDSQHTRQQGTIVNWTNSGDFAFNCTKKYTFTSKVRINATALHAASTGNDAYAMANFDDTTFNINDNCTVLFVMTYDGN